MRLDRLKDETEKERDARVAKLLKEKRRARAEEKEKKKNAGRKPKVEQKGKASA